MAREAGLKHDASPDDFAAAMLACQLYPPACSAAESCYLGNECFFADRAAIQEACRFIRIAAKNKAPAIQDAMLLAAQWLKLHGGAA